MINLSLKQLYEAHQGKVSDKWNTYLTEYDRIFEAYRVYPIRLLEIGIQNGGSLEIWTKYFPKAQKLIGCDINPDCAKLTYTDTRVSVVVGDANMDSTEASIRALSSQFDLIIDDGSHTSGDIVKSFVKYWPYIVDGGIFLAEDLHCSYWSDFDGGLFDPFSSISFFKRLSDIINYEHWGVDKTRSELLAGFFKKYNCIIDESELTRIHSVEFINSICVVRKKSPNENVLGFRCISGEEEIVVRGHQGLHLTPPNFKEHLNQQFNSLANRVISPDEELLLRLEEFEKNNLQLASYEKIFHNNIIFRKNLEDELDILRKKIQISEQQLTLMNATHTKFVAEAQSNYGFLDSRLHEKSVFNEKLEIVIQDMKDQIASLKQGINIRDADITRLNQVAHERYDLIIQAWKEIADLLASTSWRVTHPLRNISKQVKRIPRVIALLKPAINLGGGITPTAKKAVKIYLQEGVSGIKRGFRLAYQSTQPLVEKGSSSLKTKSIQTAPTLSPPVFFTGSNDYIDWVHQFDTLTDRSRANMRATQSNFTCKPMISVLMPTYNPKTEWLIEAIESVRNQIYPHWELCIADDASSDTEVRITLERYAKLDPRIKIRIRQQNGHISVASNSAAELVTGDWISLLDHDDILPEHALFWVAHTINAQPSVRLIYSDEDKTDENGRRFDPYFKSDWNPDLFYSHNMFSHLGVYHAALFHQVGGFRKGFEGAQDYDLALRCIEQIDPSQIYHIPRVLYRWRVHAESTAMAADAKPYAMIAGERAINDHFKRVGVKGSVELIGHGYQASYELPAVLPLVSIIIPTRDGFDLINQCLTSVFEKTTYSNYEILIVDNGSEDDATLKYLTTLAASPQYGKIVTVIRDDSPFNYSKLNNLAAQIARGEVLVLLNNDIEVIAHDWLSNMVSHALRPGIGAVGAKLYYPDGSLQHGGVTLGVGGVAAHAHRLAPKDYFGYFGRIVLTQNFSAVSAACLAIRKDIYQQVGGLNQVDLAVAYNDIDFCLRVRDAGYRNVYVPTAELFHHESASRGSDLNETNKVRFDNEVSYMKERWGALLQNDPAYSPNLTLGGDDFSFAWPSRAPVLPEHPQLAAFMPPPQPVDRVAKTMHALKKDGLGLEIGPSHNPMAPKKAGYNVHVLDHATAEELRIKYTGHPVNLDNIEEVDFVWRGEPLSELIGREHCYDWIVASHVIEHVTDFVGFLHQCEKLLAPDGKLSLVVPDKRFCFDYYRWPSSTGDALQAYTEKRIFHAAGTVFDHFVSESKMGDRIVWSKYDEGDITLAQPFSEAERYWHAAQKNEGYIDAHSWKFTPSSFRIILNDLQELGLTELAEVASFDTVGFEFWITLGKRQPDSVIYDRQELNRQMVREIGESIKCLA